WVDDLVLLIAHRVAEEALADGKHRRERVEISRHHGIAIVPVAALTGLEAAVSRGEGQFASALAAGRPVGFDVGGGHGGTPLSSLFPPTFLSVARDVQWR